MCGSRSKLGPIFEYSSIRYSFSPVIKSHDLANPEKILYMLFLVSLEAHMCPLSKSKKSSSVLLGEKILSVIIYRPDFQKMRTDKSSILLMLGMFNVKNTQEKYITLMEIGCTMIRQRPSFHQVILQTRIFQAGILQTRFSENEALKIAIFKKLR